MYRLVQFIKNKLPFLWRYVDLLNDRLFGMRYGNNWKLIRPVLQEYRGPIRFEPLCRSHMVSLVNFFNEQPSDAFAYFKPHDFDERTLLRLLNRKSYFMFVALDGETVIGYFFLRCFANGKAFRGKIVDHRYRNRGIAKQMGIIMTLVAEAMNLRMFGTISKHNYASMQSSEAVNGIRVVRELPDDYLYIEYLPKR